MNDYLCFRTKEDTSEVRAIKQQGMFFSTFYPEPRKKGMPRAIVIATYCLVFSFKEPNLLLLSWFSRVWLCGPHRQQPTRLPRPWDSPGKNTGVGCHFLLQCMEEKSEDAQSCLTLSDPMDCSLPGSSIHWIFQARVLEWDAIAFSKDFLKDTYLKSSQIIAWISQLAQW